MKKLLMTLMCFFALSSIPAFADGDPIDLEVEVIDPVPTTPDYGKAPISIPTIYQDGYSLSLPPYHPEYIINIVQNGVLVYSSIVPEGITLFELPSYISGECTIQFITGSICYYGIINL